MTFATALILAAFFWHGHGITLPCHPQMEAVPLTALPVVDGAPADMATLGCTIMVGPIAASYATDPDMEPWYLAEIIHEVGHTAKFPHTATGVMASPQTPDDVPWMCWHWRAVLHGIIRKQS